MGRFNSHLDGNPRAAIDYTNRVVECCQGWDWAVGKRPRLSSPRKSTPSFAVTPSSSELQKVWPLAAGETGSLEWSRI